MNKTAMYLGISIFGAIGGYVPSLLGDSALFSGWAILGSTIGGLVGVFVAVKLANLN